MLLPQGCYSQQLALRMLALLRRCLRMLRLNARPVATYLQQPTWMPLPWSVQSFAVRNRPPWAHRSALSQHLTPSGMARSRLPAAGSAREWAVLHYSVRSLAPILRYHTGHSRPCAWQSVPVTALSLCLRTAPCSCIARRLRCRLVKHLYNAP